MYFDKNSHKPFSGQVLVTLISLENFKIVVFSKNYIQNRVSLAEN